MVPQSWQSIWEFPLQIIILLPDCVPKHSKMVSRFLLLPLSAIPKRFVALEPLTGEQPCCLSRWFLTNRKGEARSTRHQKENDIYDGGPLLCWLIRLFFFSTVKQAFCHAGHGWISPFSRFRSFHQSENSGGPSVDFMIGWQPTCQQVTNWGWAHTRSTKRIQIQIL